MRRALLLATLCLLPRLALAQRDSGTVRVTYEMLKGAVVSATFDESRTAGFFPFVYQGRTARPGRRVAVPMRPQGCARNERLGTYTVNFDAAFGPEGLPTSGPPNTQLSLQVGGYPWDRTARYAGPDTYPQSWVLGPNQVAKSWIFRQKGKRMWDQLVLSNSGSASVTINRDQRSGTFVLGPYLDNAKRERWTVRGTFACSRVMMGPADHAP